MNRQAHDQRNVPSVLAAKHFEQIVAPAKHLVWFERSAHNPPFEEPDEFVRALVAIVNGEVADSAHRGRTRF